MKPASWSWGCAVLGMATLLASVGCNGSGGPEGGAEIAGPRQDPLTGGPHPALLVTQAQFDAQTAEDGKTRYVPGAAKLVVDAHHDSWPVNGRANDVHHRNVHHPNEYIHLIPCGLAVKFHRDAAVRADEKYDACIA